MESESQKIALIVDDEKDLVDLMGARIERRGFKILGANTASEALAKFESHAVSIVICDIHLGTGNGIDFYRRCRTAGSTVPFIFVSGSVGLENHRFEIADDEGCVLMEKPIDFQELLAVVRRLVP
jgi:two-component system chemotaxis response regulator CheY